MSFRLQVVGIAESAAVRLLRSVFRQHGVEPLDVRKPFGVGAAELTFASEELLRKAAEVLPGVDVQGHAVRVLTGDAMDASLFKAAARQSSDQQGGGKRGKAGKPVPECTADVVAPLWRLAYSEQLAQKTQHVQATLRDMASKLRAAWSEASAEESAKHKPALEPLTLERMVESPVRDGYRNKCEFTIGLDKDGKPCVGFLLGLFKDGIKSVGSAEGCPNVSEQTIAATKVLQGVVAASTLPVYEKATHKGFWRLMGARSNRRGELMVVLQVQSASFDDDAVRAELERARDALVVQASLGVVSVFAQRWNGDSNACPSDHPVELLHGVDSIVESVLGLSFRISPASFFQVNTQGAEVLYDIARTWCSASAADVVLDICCGTGTIALCMSAAAKSVVGVEMVQAAVTDAIANAERNGCQNVRFVCGKAEDALPAVLREHKRALAIVDPPRSGLHPSVCRTMRNAPGINRIVYVSCNPSTLVDNAIILCRPETRKFAGAPFRPTRVIAVDMFPHTNHCEMVMLFEREPAVATLD